MDERIKELLRQAKTDRGDVDAAKRALRALERSGVRPPRWLTQRVDPMGGVQRVKETRDELRQERGIGGGNLDVETGDSYQCQQAIKNLNEPRETWTFEHYMDAITHINHCDQCRAKGVFRDPSGTRKHAHDPIPQGIGPSPYAGEVEWPGEEELDDELGEDTPEWIEGYMESKLTAPQRRLL